MKKGLSAWKQWNAFEAVIVRHGRKLVVAVRQVVERGPWLAIALEYPAGATTPHEVLNAHAHAVLEPAKSLRAAKKIARKYAEGWAALQVPALTDCPCKPIPAVSPARKTAKKKEKRNGK